MKASNWSGWRALVGAAFCSLMALGAQAAVPGQMNVQGQLLNAEGQTVDGTYSITFTLYDGQGENATAVWTETKTNVMAMNGYFDAVLGDGLTPLAPTVFANNAALWLGVKIESGPGVDPGGEDELPRRPLSSVGYAMEAMMANNVDCAGCVDIDDVGFATLAGLTCTINQSLVYVGGNWTCTDKVPAAVSADQSLDLSCTGCVADTELAFDPATQTELDDEVTALLDLIPTSVNGFAGGTITGDVTVDGTLSATMIMQNGNQVCDTSGNCGDSLSALECADGQVPTFSEGAWGCGAGGGTPEVDDCTGDWNALQWDGTAFVCVDVRASGLSSGEANQFETIDPWGYAWDGQQRAPKTWAEATADCEGDGGRLPTATEIYRNSHGSAGTGAVGDPTDSDYLWTNIQEYRSNYRMAFRINDGASTSYTTTTTRPYRCVWPDENPTDFSSDHCYGEPGEGCTQTGLVYNVDTRSRPALDYVAANHECRFYNGQLIRVREVQELMQREEGWMVNNTAGEVNQWHWGGDPVYNGGSYGSLYKWPSNQNRFQFWAYSNQNDHGSYATLTSKYRFRCYGKRAGFGQAQESPQCYQGSCFSVDANNVKITADAIDRPTANLAQAHETCRLLGAELPTVKDMYTLIHNGMENGTNNWLWGSEFTYWSSYGHWIYRFTTQGDVWYHVNSSGSTVATPTNNYAFRCVWHEHVEEYGSPTVCENDQNQNWDGTEFSCEDKVDGTSCDENNGNCKALPSPLFEFVDVWGNAWDLQQRNAATYADAQAVCELNGARLPTAGELYRVRNGASTGSVGDINSTSYLWTLNPEYRTGRRTTLRISDGDADQQAETSNMAYRCIWPSTKGDVFGGRSCYGATEVNGTDVSSCYQVNHLRMDSLDRPAVNQAAAAWECDFFGGRLPTAQEFTELVHSGAPNGSDNYLWTVNPVSWSSNRGYNTARWSGSGTTTWQYGANSVHTLDHVYTYRPFRCVFSDRLD